MKRMNHHQIRFFALAALFLFQLNLQGCGNNNKTDVGPYVRNDEKPVDSADTATRTQLATIDEKIPSKGYRVWLNKEFWLGKKIWVSLGVERASLTGLAMSVDGYHSAYLEKSGAFLVLKKDNSGLYGGSVLGPDLPLNAYPIVEESPTEILVDLSRPKTSYGLTLTNFNAGDYADTELAPRFDYVKSISTSGNRLSFFTVSTTKSPVPLFDPEGDSAEAAAGQDPFLLSMTLRNDWVIPTENPGYESEIASPDSLGFFLTDPRVIKNGVGTEQMIQKISTHQLFNWEVSGNTPLEYRDAVKKSILSWNPSLSTERDVLSVSFAEGFKESVTDPTVSNLVWDDNMAVGFAFANWRSNPLTGEIVQAEVYMSGAMWAEGAKITFQLRKLEEQVRAEAKKAEGSAPGSSERRDSVANLSKLRKKVSAMVREARSIESKSAKQRVGFVGLNSGLAKAKARSKAYCFRTIEITENVAFLQTIDADLDEALKDLDGETEAERQPDVVHSEHDDPTHLPYTAEGVDEATFAKQVVHAVLMHEVGHTIGLRHNFMGSLGTSNDGAVGSASIMDYNDLVIDSQFTEPGKWDKYVAEAVYLKKEFPEPFSFCTDEMVEAGLPTCTPFDFSANPMKGQHVREQSNLLLAEVMLWFGQVDMALNLITKGLSSNVDKINYVLFPAEDASNALNDPSFGESQLSTWKLLIASMDMQGTEWPDYLKVAYRDILVNLLTNGTTPMTASSFIANELTGFYKETLLASATFQFPTRKAVLNGLVSIQTAGGRGALVEAKSVLEEKLKTVDRTTLPDAEKEALTVDEEILLHIKKVLEQDGYYKSAALN